MTHDGPVKTVLTARTAARMIVALAVVLAGCSSVIDSAEDRAKDAAEGAVNDAVNDSVGGVFNASAMANVTDVPDNVTVVGFGFDQPETYTYEVAMGQSDRPSVENQQTRGRLVVEVQEGSSKTATLTKRYELDGETSERTVSGSQQEVAVEFVNDTRTTNASPAMRELQTYANLAATLGMSLYLAGYVTPLVEGQSLPSGDEESVKYEAMGTDSYAGVECSVTRLSVNGTPSVESCVSADHGLPVYTVLYDGNGTADTRMELVEYES